MHRSEHWGGRLSGGAGGGDRGGCRRCLSGRRTGAAAAEAVGLIGSNAALRELHQMWRLCWNTLRRTHLHESEWFPHQHTANREGARGDL